MIWFLCLLSSSANFLYYTVPFLKDSWIKSSFVQREKKICFCCNVFKILTLKWLSGFALTDRLVREYVSLYFEILPYWATENKFREDKILRSVCVDFFISSFRGSELAYIYICIVLFLFSPLTPGALHGETG